MIYAISDIHAHTKLFNKFYKTLKEDDTVYVLGDIIDKGDGTLDIFKTIIYDDRFTLLLGNHEWFFYKYLTSSGFLKEWYRENGEVLKWLRGQFAKLLGHKSCVGSNPTFSAIERRV